MGMRFVYFVANVIIFYTVYYIFRWVEHDDHDIPGLFLLVAAYSYASIMSYLWQIHDLLTEREL